jgi:quercetin dioxygenase-like cupin family protein
LSALRTAVLALFSIVFGHAAQAQIAQTIIDNQRVSVKKFTLEPRQAGTMQRHDRDFVELVLSGGKIRTTESGGKMRIAVRQFGNAIYGKRGTVLKEELISGAPAQIVEVDLKDYSIKAPPNKTRYPSAFPRAGAKNALDNDRVAVWTFTWKKGQATPMHYHAADIVGVFRYKGQVKSTAPNGQSSVTNYTAGEVRYTRGNRVHSETLIGGRESAILLELK